MRVLLPAEKIIYEQSPVKVTISVPYANVGLTGMSIFPAPTNLVAVAFMAKEGP